MFLCQSWKLVKKGKKVKLAMIILTIVSIFYLYRFFEKDKNFVKSWVIIYRILGNDLPPRHSFNQTLTNLLFILENEPSFPNVTKIWILNRIVDNYKEQILINLLNKYKKIYIRIPFYWNEYRQIPYYFPSNYSSDDYFNSTEFYQLTSFDKLFFVDALYYEKNLYVMNNNGARNFSLRHGKEQTRAQWLMIFDSNCFLSQEGYDQIYQSILINGSRVQHFIIPMIRLMNNSQVFNGKRTNITEEPQIIFRRDSSVEFLYSMRYGQRSKQELLEHLGVERIYWKASEWTAKLRKTIVLSENKSNTLFQYTSFVFRLSSYVNPENEQSISVRACSRYEGVMFFLDNLDFQLTHRQLLPKPLKGNPSECVLWYDQQIGNIVKTARQSLTNNSHL